MERKRKGAGQLAVVRLDTYHTQKTSRAHPYYAEICLYKICRLKRVFSI